MNRLLLLILLAYLGITVGYNIAVPLFEAPDEHWHYFTVQYIQENGRLPIATTPHDPWTAQEAAQPPLYYAIGALLIAPFDTTDAKPNLWLNPSAVVGDASALTNINRMVHTDRESWPWRGYVAAAHMLRGFSAVLGLGTLLCIYGSARLLWPAEPPRALLAVALPAFLPQFNFVHAAISNDPLIIFLCSLALWQLLHVWQTAITPARLLLLGLTIGLAALSKNAGTLLLAYATGGIVFKFSGVQVFKKHHSPLEHLNTWSLVYLLLPALLLMVPLWWRNWTLYGDITAVSVFVRIAGGDRGYTLWQVLAESSGLWSSLFAIFGWFNLRAPEWVYGVWNGLVGVMGMGYGVWGIKTSQKIQKKENNFASFASFAVKSLFSPLVLLAGWVALVYGGLVLFMLQTEAAQGRLLFPAILPLSLLAVNGISAVIEPLRLHVSRFALHFFPLLAFLTTLYCLLFVIRPAYAKPPIVAQLPATATPLNSQLAEGVWLVGAEVETKTAESNTPVWLTLYWQTTSTLAQPPAFKLELFGREMSVVAHLHSYHGRGLYPANLWPPGQIIADRFAVRLDEAVAAPVLGRLFVRIVDEPASAEVGQVKIVATTWPQPIQPPLAHIGEGIELSAVSLSTTTAHPGDTIQIAVTWQVTAVPNTHYTTLIHLAAPGQPPLATGDRPPLNGQYPTTIWAVGEVIEDSYELTIPEDLPNGRYPLWLGLYDPTTGNRLPLTINTQPQPNDVYLLGWLEVAASTR